MPAGKSQTTMCNCGHAHGQECFCGLASSHDRLTPRAQKEILTWALVRIQAAKTAQEAREIAAEAIGAFNNEH